MGPTECCGGFGSVLSASTMPLNLRNTLTHTLEPFIPLDAKRESVLMYTCGPTVYSYAHIGNFRSFLLADTLRRVLERRGYRVRHVMNITDVGHMTEDHLADASGEDKLSRAARELGWDPYEVAAHFERAFAEDAKKLGLKNYRGDEANDLSLHPRATGHVPEMLALIQTLLDKGFAYTDADGQVYFEISSFPEYGKLSGKKLEELEVGARVDVREEKRDPRDFALWKTDSKHLMQWDPHTGEGFRDDEFARLKRLIPSGVSPAVAKGFPGWHIECSAMALAQLGATIDIHTGGEDNLFPHHECENAQSCAALGVNAGGLDALGLKSFARYWVHGRHLLVNGRKMSKRDGTFYTVRDLLAPAASGRAALAAELQAAGFPEGQVAPEVLRLTLLSTHHHQPMNFSVDLLVQARSQVQRLQTRYERLQELIAAQTPEEAVSDAVQSATQSAREAFDAALDDDLNIPGAIAAACAFAGQLNQMELCPADAAHALATLQEFDEVLGVLRHRVSQGLLDKATLAAWETPERLRQAALDLIARGPQSGEQALLGQLEQGQAPDAGALDALPAPDAPLTEVLLGLRHGAKRQKRYEVADAIRSILQRHGVTVEDLPQGVRYKLP